MIRLKCSTTWASVPCAVENKEFHNSSRCVAQIGSTPKNSVQPWGQPAGFIGVLVGQLGYQCQWRCTSHPVVPTPSLFSTYMFAFGFVAEPEGCGDGTETNASARESECLQPPLASVGLPALSLPCSLRRRTVQMVAELPFLIGSRGHHYARIHVHQPRLRLVPKQLHTLSSDHDTISHSHSKCLGPYDFTYISRNLIGHVPYGCVMQ